VQEKFVGLILKTELFQVQVQRMQKVGTKHRLDAKKVTTELQLQLAK
jgi:hypothetical protein